MNQIESIGVGIRPARVAPCSTSVGSFLELKMKTKWCPRCETDKFIEEFGKNRRQNDGLQVHCRKCRRDYYPKQREYRRNHKNEIRIQTKAYKQRHKKDITEYFKRYRAEYPECRKAQNAVIHAIRDGKIIRPDRCSNPKCNKLCIPEGHHWSYEEKYWLDVEWLCTSCHQQLHVKLRQPPPDKD